MSPELISVVWESGHIMVGMVLAEPSHCVVVLFAAMVS